MSFGLTCTYITSRTGDIPQQPIPVDLTKLRCSMNVSRDQVVVTKNIVNFHRSTQVGFLPLFRYS